MSVDRRWLRRGVVAGVVLLAAFLVGFVPRLRARQELEARTEHRSAAPPVAVTPAIAGGLSRDLTLPGSLVAMQETLVYARASGYVRRWHVDIGARVRESELLAELDTPELDRQLDQARAALVQKRAVIVQMDANNAFLQLTAQRQRQLREEKLVAQQDADQATAQAEAGAANVAAARADAAAARATVRQLEQMVAYGRVVAPFAGTITQRLVDVGSLVNAGAAQGGALYQLQATDPLRVFVQVPQPYAPKMRAGVEAALEVRQYAGRRFAAKVTRTAGALDPATRTLNTELQVPNPDGELFPGMFVDVKLPVAVSHPVVRIPSSAVVSDSAGVHVVVVDPQSRVHLAPVQPGQDDGTSVEIVDGLRGGEHVAVSPPAGLVEGQQVQAVAAPARDGGR